MTVDASLSFAKVIEEHLELKRRNATLNGDMPIERYRIDDPFENHPLFKSEEQARIEDTASGTQPMAADEELVLAWPSAETEVAEPTRADDSFWSRSRDFDWGD